VPLHKGQGVSLDCGTLILIVLIFGRGGAADIEREMRGLRSMSVS
jgi:hypothetical protein